jgi:hypothetical protein
LRHLVSKSSMHKSDEVDTSHGVAILAETAPFSRMFARQIEPERKNPSPFEGDGPGSGGERGLGR